MKKKSFTILLCCVLALAILAACSNVKPVETAPVTEPPHIHAAAGDWQWDVKEHYRMCDCGETIDRGEHQLSESVCSVCAVELVDYGDGYVDAIGYNQYGDLTRWVSYNSNGDVLYDNVYEFEYDADGNKLKEKSYVDGKFQSETEYALDKDGNSYPVRTVSYQENGEYYENLYDQEGNLISVMSYDADDNLVFQYFSEYALDSDGNSYEVKYTEIDADGAKLIVEYNEYGDPVSRLMYNADGSLESEDAWFYEYDAEGDPLWEMQYRDGMLIYEITGYATYESEDYSMRYPETVIEYHEDGCKLVTQYGDNGEVASETHYYADGSVDSVRTYVYETDDEGNWTSKKEYLNHALMCDIEYSINSDGWTYMTKMTEYHDDGTKTVYEYNEYEELVNQTQFDADGNEIQ